MDPADAPPKVKPSPIAQAGGLVATGVGIVVGRYSGLNLLIPIAAAFAIGWVASKLMSPASKPMLVAVALQGGHVLWLLIGTAILGGPLINFVEVALVAAAIGWLAMRPGLVPAFVLIGYQALSIVMNTINFMGAEFGSATHRALTVHLILRACAILLIVIGLRGLSRAKAAPVEPH